MVQRVSGEAWCERVQRQDRSVLQIGGRWTVFTIGRLVRRLDVVAKGPKPESIDVSAIEDLDTAGATELLDLARRLGGSAAQPIPFDGAKPHHARLIELVVAQNVRPERKERIGWLVSQLLLIGRGTVAVLVQARNLLSFLGETLVTILVVMRSPRRLRVVAIVNLMEEVWVRALPIVGTLVFLIGVVLAYQGVEQLKRFGAQAFTVDMVGISILREIGVLLTAIIVAGRSGSAFTAQIGTMKVNQEVDAMATMGLSPIEVLVLPRIVALVLTMPLLVFFADIMGLLGGALACSVFLDFTLSQYFDRVQDVTNINHFWVGMIKAPVFAFVVAVVGSYEGLQVTGSAESVGRLTTKSVVESIFLVIILDAAFSILFVSLGI